MLSTFSVPVRSREFKILRGMPSFTIVVPSSSALFQKLGIETLMTLRAYTDTDYEELGLGNPDVRDNFKAAINYDVLYIRECRLKDVIGAEWSKHYGPPTPRDFILASDGLFSIDTIVKVVNFEKHAYDLGSLNRDYERPKSKKRTVRRR